ncbi:MAG: serine hydrolase [Candidatus Levyibacteriota bacterium]
MSNVKKILILILSLVLIDFAIVKYLESPQSVVLKELINPSLKLEKVVKQELLDSNGAYAVAIKNLKTGESYYLDEKREFEAASLYKLWILAEAMNQVQAGRIRESDVLKEEIADLNETFNISSESAELTEGTVEATIKEAMRQMIVISHNYSALALSKRIGISNANKFIKDNGFKQTSLAQPPKTTAYDALLFFEKLYKGELVSKEKSGEMMSLFKMQQLNNKLPKYLPEDVEVAHKTGELGFFSHDGGIVFGEKGDYIIVVLSNSSYPPAAVERIASISKAVYDYFEKK